MAISNLNQIFKKKTTFASMSEFSADTGADLSEIDARLQALQEYMRDLDTGC